MERMDTQEKLDRLEINYDYLKEENKRLEEENKKLKSDLSECECSMHYENDEVGFWKRECKKLKEELEKLRTDNVYEEGLYD